MGFDLARLRLFGPTVLLVGVVVALGGVTVGMVVYQQTTLADQVSRELEADLRDRVDAWEGRLVERLAIAAEGAALDPNAGAFTQARLRQETPWFDSLYLWAPATRGVTGTNPGLLDWPRLPPDERQAARAYCVIQGRLVRSQGVFDRVRSAETMRALCRDEAPAVRLVALTEAVDLLLRHGYVGEALMAIEAENLIPDGTDLKDAAQAGMPIQRAVVLRLEHADIHDRLGDPELADELRAMTGFEIAALDAPDAEQVAQYITFPILDRLRRSGRADAVDRLTAALERVERRVLAWRHIRDDLLLRTAQPGAPARWVYDQHADHPYVLYTRWSDSGTAGVALQLDQDLLIEDFLEEMRSARKLLTVTNADGTRVLGGVRRSGKLAFTLPFSSTLTHLRVGLRAEAIDERVGRQSRGLWVLIALALFAVGVGVVAVATDLRARIAQRRANAELQALLGRQRDFATRVTHELKTPLAGIRVMAENLELGHVQDAYERRSMARAIVLEADRLTDRVNEILAVAREREVAPPEPFDPSDAVVEAVEQWEPRMDHAGVLFESDIGTTDPVVGDRAALRDAVSCLLDNALKYHREDADPPTVSLTLAQDGPTVRIEVVDNGLGVPEAMRASIFERFVRVEGPNRGKAGGHGLGLAQVAEIVRALGGTARCEEGVDGGARFVVELPSARPRPAYASAGLDDSPADST